MCTSTSRVPYMGILAVIFITMTMGPVDAEIGYDCGSRIQNLATISLVDIDDCDLNVDEVTTSPVEMALLQLNEFEHINVVQCKVVINRYIVNCGMSSHNSVVKNGFHEYVEAISREDCLNAIKSGSLKVKGTDVFDLMTDGPNTRQITFAGSKTYNGGCSGAAYSDPYGSWTNVVATGTAFITLRSTTARAKVEDDKIILPSGYQCKLSKGECVDFVGGHTFWNALPRNNCSANTYSLLYKGTATQYESNADTVYTVNITDTSFSFTALGLETSCGATLLKTESPKLFLVQSRDLKHLQESNIVQQNTDGFDMFQYVNAKFVYVEKHIRSQVKSLYLDVMKHQCRLEKEILKNSLAIASTQPDEFAFRYMDGPGYMAVMAGEVIHIVQCVPVEVKLNHVDECYNRLPVLRGNESVFLMPRTHIITKRASVISCNSALLEYYKLEKTWYKLTPKIVDVASPTKLKPSSKMTWSYQNPANLASSGIYTQEDLDSMRERIMFPVEQKVITGTIVQQFSNGMGGQVSIANALNDYIWNNLFTTIWAKIWGPFAWFGSTAAGLVGVFVVVQMIKFLLDIIINGYQLYSKYGCSPQLFSCFWNSLAKQYLVETEQEEEEDETNELVKRPKA